MHNLRFVKGNYHTPSANWQNFVTMLFSNKNAYKQCNVAVANFIHKLLPLLHNGCIVHMPYIQPYINVCRAAGSPDNHMHPLRRAWWGSSQSMGKSF